MTESKGLTILDLYSSDASCTATSQPLTPPPYTRFLSSLQYLKEHHTLNTQLHVCVCLWQQHQLVPLYSLCWFSKGHVVLLKRKVWIGVTTNKRQSGSTTFNHNIEQTLTDTKYGPAKSLMTPVEVQMPMCPMKGKNHLWSQNTFTASKCRVMTNSSILCDVYIYILRNETFICMVMVGPLYNNYKSPIDRSSIHLMYINIYCSLTAVKLNVWNMMTFVLVCAGSAFAYVIARNIFELVTHVSTGIGVHTIQ